MFGQVLVREKKYEGKYVALESYTNNRVVASGDTPLQVANDAEKNGVTHPVIIFIPKEKMAHIY